MELTRTVQYLIKIIKGQTKSFDVRLENERTNEPFDLTSAVVTVQLPADGGGSVDKDSDAIGGVTITNALAGKFSVALSDSDTELLKEGLGQTLEIHINIAGQKTILQLKKVLDIYEQAYSGPA